MGDIQSCLLLTDGSAHRKGLRGSALQPKVAHHSFSLLRKLVGNTGQLPVSYSVKKGARFRVEEKIFACGGFADVRKGKLNKRTVAVKTIRIAQDTNITKIRKVSATMGFFSSCRRV